jgi:acyl-CoA synthetase (AMP-forming)/AMP-acid ligase II
VRYAFPGDFATVEANGSITLLGRGSACINSRGQLASYKLPKRILLVDVVRRAPNGKADYAWAREHALASLGLG